MGRSHAVDANEAVHRCVAMIRGKGRCSSSGDPVFTAPKEQWSDNDRQPKNICPKHRHLFREVLPTSGEVIYEPPVKEVKKRGEQAA